jgi:hypothetical protein
MHVVHRAVKKPLPHVTVHAQDMVCSNYRTKRSGPFKDGAIEATYYYVIVTPRAKVCANENLFTASVLFPPCRRSPVGLLIPPKRPLQQAPRPCQWLPVCNKRGFQDP